MAKSRNSETRWGAVICDGLLILSFGTSAALILHDLREHTKTLEGVVEEQRLLREQVKTLMSSIESLSSAVDVLAVKAFTTPSPRAGASRGLQAAADTTPAKSNAAKSNIAKPVRAKKKRDRDSKSDTGGRSQETSVADDAT